MSGPWEKYRRQKEQRRGPWERYRGAVTPNDEASPIPTEIISQGRKAVAEIIDGPSPNEGPPPIPREEIQAAIDSRKNIEAKSAAVLNKAGESLTLGGVGDEAAGAFDEMIGRGGREERTQFYRDQEKQLEERHPGVAFAAEVAPAFIPGAGAAGAVAKLGSVTGRTTAAGITGAAAGGLYGAMEADEGDRLQQGALTATAGFLLGAAAPKLTDFAASIPKNVRTRFVMSSERPTIERLKQAKNAAYKAVDEAGETFDGQAMQDLALNVRRSFEANNYVEETDNALKATLALLDRRAGKETTLTQLDGIRQNLWKRYASAKDQPQILDAIAAIDDVIQTRGSASELMQLARAANARYAKSKLLDDAFRKADDQVASTGSGGNTLNKYRQAVTAIINNEKKAKYFADSELAMMREFVRGSNSENVKRLLGKMSPNGNGLMMTLHAVGGLASNGATLPLMGIGALAKKSADESVERGAREIQEYLAGVTPKALPRSTGAPLAVGSAPVADRIQNATRNTQSLRR